MNEEELLEEADLPESKQSCLKRHICQREVKHNCLKRQSFRVNEEELLGEADLP